MRPANANPSDRVLSIVPSMKALVADLKLAEIDYGDKIKGFADFHALRTSLNTMMAVSGMNTRMRQAQMRHTDPRLTEITYLDEKLLPIAQELAKVPAIPTQNPQPEPRPVISPTSSEVLKRFREAQRRESAKSSDQHGAGLMQETRVSSGQGVTQPGNAADHDDSRPDQAAANASE